MTNLDSVLKSRDITLPTQVQIVKAMVFPVVMYARESWTIKKAEHRRTDAFELWCWRRLLRVPWTARWSNQSVLTEINPEYSLQGLMLMLKLQYSGYLMWRADSVEKTLMLGKIEGKRRRGDRGWHGWMASSAKWTWVWASSVRWWRTRKPGMPQSMGSKNWKQLRDWTTHCLPQCLQQFTFPPTVRSVPSSPHPHQLLSFVVFLKTVILDQCEVIAHCDSDLHLPDVKHLFMCHWPSAYLLWKIICLDPPPIFLHGK